MPPLCGRVEAIIRIMRYILIFGLSALLVALDQFSKHLVTASLALHETVPMTGFFSLVHVLNRGAAFGFLNDPDMTWQFWLFLGATLLAVIVVWIIARSAASHERFLFIGLGCILGGAIGNLIDRIRFRAVIDFLDFHLAGMHWPAFNVADIAICIGAGVVALQLLRPKGTFPKSENSI